MTSETITIKADSENSAEAFWSGPFDEAYPEIADQIRNRYTAVVDAATWAAIQNLEGFSDGPSYARDALLVVCND